MKHALLIAASLAALVGGFGISGAAHGQTMSSNVVSSCGSASYTAGYPYPTTQDTTGKLCDSGGSGGAAGPPVGAATFTPGALSGSPLTVTSSATQVVVARTGAAGTGRALLIVENEGTIDLRCGGSGVTFAGGTGAAAGVLLPGTKGAAITLPYTGALYCIASSASGTVSVAEVY